MRFRCLRTVSALLPAAAVVLVPRVVPPCAAQDVALTPKNVVAFALSQNPSMLSAVYDVGAELQNVEGASARFKPSLGLRAAYTHLNEPPSMSPSSFGFPAVPGVTLPDEVAVGPQDIWSVGYTVSQPVFTSMRTVNAYRSARLKYQSSQHALARLKQETRLNALQLYWSYVAALQGLKPLEESVAWLEQLSRDLQALVQAGVVVEDEKLRTQTQLALAKLALVRARDNLADAGERVLLFCNLPLRTRIVIDSLVLGALERDTLPPDTEVAADVAQREDIRALQLQVEALQAVRRVQAAAHLPSLMAMFAQDFRNQDPHEPAYALENTWSVSAALEWKLLDWGAARSERNKTDTTLAKLRLALDARKRQAESEVLSARRRVAQSFEAQRLALESVDNAQRALRNADARYREGLATGTDLLNYRRELTMAQQELIAARIRKVLAFEEYRTALGE